MNRAAAAALGLLCAAATATPSAVLGESVCHTPVDLSLPPGLRERVVLDLTVRLKGGRLISLETRVLQAPADRRTLRAVIAHVHQEVQRLRCPELPGFRTQVVLDGRGAAPAASAP